MAKLLTFAATLLTLSFGALAQGICPDFINVTRPFIITEIVNGVYDQDAYYAVSCTTAIDQSGGNGDTKGCSTAPAFITRYVNGEDPNHFDTSDGCVWQAATKVSSAPTALGCNYQFTAGDGFELFLNVSCGAYNFLMGSEVDIVTAGNSKRYAFTATATGVCGTNTLTTVTYPTPPTTSGPTTTTVSAATTASTTSSASTSSVSSASSATSHTVTSATSTTVVPGPSTAVKSTTPSSAPVTDLTAKSTTMANTTTTTVTTSTTTMPTTTAPAGTNVTFVSHTSDASLLVQYIQDYLDTTRLTGAVLNSIVATCNQTINADGNYTCVATFANYTQAAEVVAGANEGKISIVASAHIDNPVTTTPAKKDDDGSKVGLIVGVIVGGVVAVTIFAVVAVFVCRRPKTDEGMSLNKNLM